MGCGLTARPFTYKGCGVLRHSPFIHCFPISLGLVLRHPNASVACTSHVRHGLSMSTPLFHYLITYTSPERRGAGLTLHLTPVYDLHVSFLFPSAVRLVRSSLWARYAKSHSLPLGSCLCWISEHCVSPLDYTFLLVLFLYLTFGGRSRDISSAVIQKFLRYSLNNTRHHHHHLISLFTSSHTSEPDGKSMSSVLSQMWSEGC